MPRPQKLSDQEIVAAAWRVIAAKGPGGLRLSDVGELAGVAPATLVERFGSKRGLLLAVAEAGSDGVAETFAAAHRVGTSAVAALERALVDLAASLGDASEVSNHLAFLALDLADPTFRAHAARHARVLEREIARVLQRAADADELLQWASVPALARLVHALYQGTLLTWAIDQRGRPGTRIRRQLRVALAPYLADGDSE